MADRDHLEPRERKRDWRPWVIGVVVLLALIFIFQNSQKVQVDFIFATTNTPLIFALLVATLLGIVIGWLAPRLRRHRD